MGLTDMASEFAGGVAFGAGGILIGAMLGSFAHTAGDTSSSGSDATVTAVTIGMAIGYTLGSALGVNFMGDKRQVKGLKALTYVGSIIGGTGGLLLYSKKKNVLTGITLGILPPLLATIFFNLVEDR